MPAPERLASLPIALALAAPFPPSEVRFRPGATSGNRALALPFVDARSVMNRLDEVFGVGGWQTSYTVLPDGVVCRLRVKIGEQWVEHQDAGGYSEQPDAGDRLKSGFSESLKRVAVHLGIGRYLYRVPQLWVDWDAQKKRFAKEPTLPAVAAPKPTAPPAKVWRA